MAIIINTHNPELILDLIRKKIDEGEIDTWSYDSDGDFTHVGQWQNKAWFTPFINDQELSFFIVGRKNVQMELMEYSIYHGRFVELLLNHFPMEISKIEVKAPFEHPVDCNNINI